MNQDWLTIEETENGRVLTKCSEEAKGEIIIPEGVTCIGESAYRNCYGLTSIVIPDSVTSIGDRAFDDCDGLTSIVIPNSVTSIGESAFSGCRGLTSIDIPDSVTSIGESAFSNCRGLTSIVIPDSVTSIGDSAFLSCSGLTSIVIPNSVTIIGNSTFDSCSGLTEIRVEEGNKVYDSRENCNAIIERETNTLVLGCRNTFIPDSVTIIGKGAFYGCYGLTSIVIPNSVTSIGNSAFFCCRLTSIVIPNSVTSIGNSAFVGCGLKEIRVEEGNKVYDSRENCNAIIERETNTLVVGCRNAFVPNSVTSIGNSAFWNCSGLTSIVIPKSVTSIGDSAFWNCSGLTSIDIPDSVTSIGNSAFCFCEGLTSIDIPDSVTSIGESSFFGCSGLTSIVIPDSVTSIGDGAFSDCSGLTSIEIPNSVTSIGDRAFSGCSGLTSIVIPDSVTSIGDYVFYSCKGLKEIYVGMECIKKGIFKTIYDDPYVKNYTLHLDSLKFSDKVKKVEKQDWQAAISVLDFEGQIPETNGSFGECIIETLRVNRPRKQVQIPSDITKALDNAQRSEIIYAAPELCEKASSTIGYIKATLAKNDEIVDINVQYIVSVEPCELKRYNPVVGSCITLAAKHKELGYQIIVYEPCEMVMKKIEDALETFSKNVGGVVGLFNMLETLCKAKRPSVTAID